MVLQVAFALLAQTGQYIFVYGHDLYFPRFTIETLRFVRVMSSTRSMIPWQPWSPRISDSSSLTMSCMTYLQMIPKRLLLLHEECLDSSMTWWLRCWTIIHMIRSCSIAFLRKMYKKHNMELMEPISPDLDPRFASDNSTTTCQL